MRMSNAFDAIPPDSPDLRGKSNDWFVGKNQEIETVAVVLAQYVAFQTHNAICVFCYLFHQLRVFCTIF